MTLWEMPEPQRNSVEIQKNTRPSWMADRQSYDLIVVTVRNAGADFAPQERSHHWADDAACVKVSEYDDILRKCGGCPVWQQCYDDAVKRRLTGPYGGRPFVDGKPSTKRTW
jgi:hypothetical protein